MEIEVYNLLDAGGGYINTIKDDRPNDTSQHNLMTVINSMTLFLVWLIFLSGNFVLKFSIFYLFT